MRQGSIRVASTVTHSSAEDIVMGFCDTNVLSHYYSGKQILSKISAMNFIIFNIILSRHAKLNAIPAARAVQIIITDRFSCNPLSG